MAREIKRSFDTAARQIILEIEDDFGNVSKHTISLTSDKCHQCGQSLPANQGNKDHTQPDGVLDVNAAALGLVAHVDGMMPGLIAKFEAAAQGDPELLKHIRAAKARRDGNA